MYKTTGKILKKESFQRAGKRKFKNLTFQSADKV